MRFDGSISPEQLAVLHQVFNERCREAGINPDDPGHETLALRIIGLFQSGVQTAEEIVAALNRHDFQPHFRAA